MKKRAVFLALILVAALFALALSGCGTPSYTVTFDLNGGELVSGEAVQTVKEGESAVFPEVTNGDKVLEWVGDPTNVTVDTTVTAHWKGWYTVTFDLNGGELISGETEQRILEGEDAVLPEVTNGKRELSWKGDWRNVTADATVEAEWTKVAMNTVDLAEYVQERTVTVDVKTIDGAGATGSGFFIAEDGTLVTNFHVVEGAAEITVETGGGAHYPVKEVVDFNHLYDVAVLRLDLSNCAYLEFAENEARTGEQVYAVGSALGTLKGSFTAGIVSSTKRSYGMIDCLQMDTPISSGNSGGPLVNIYGEVVGINTASYVDGESLNLAIKPATLDLLSMDKHWTVREFREWYEQESARSWGAVYNGYYFLTLVNTYQEVTGSPCLGSGMNDEEGLYEGYDIGFDFYEYAYQTDEFNRYVSYLKDNGFVYQGSEDYSGGTSYFYYNEKDSILIDLFVFTGNEGMYIWPTLE